MSNEKKAMFASFGALGYGPEKMALVLGCDVGEVDDMLAGELGDAYRAGEARHEFAVRRKLLELAASGDMKAMTRLDKIRLDEKR